MNYSSLRDAGTRATRPILALSPDDQRQDDALLRVECATAAMGMALSTPGPEARRSALGAACALPETAQVALTQFAIDWLVFAAAPRHGTTTAARHLADAFLAETSTLEGTHTPPNALNRPPRAD